MLAQSMNPPEQSKNFCCMFFFYVPAFHVVVSARMYSNDHSIGIQGNTSSISSSSSIRRRSNIGSIRRRRSNRVLTYTDSNCHH
jgi:hypothetical protein